MNRSLSFQKVTFDSFVFEDGRYENSVDIECYDHRGDEFTAATLNREEAVLLIEFLQKVFNLQEKKGNEK